MTFQYASVEEAIKRSGLRMVVVGGVPSPWGAWAFPVVAIGVCVHAAVDKHRCKVCKHRWR
jgi:hypothetical protein